MGTRRAKPASLRPPTVFRAVMRVAGWSAPDDFRRFADSASATSAAGAGEVHGSLPIFGDISRCLSLGGAGAISGYHEAIRKHT